MVHGTPGYRGTRVGVALGSAPRHQSDHGDGEQLPRIRVPYWCAKGHETRLVFLKLPDEQIPKNWDCPKCGLLASRDPGQVAETRPEDDLFKSHLDYVKERRSSQDAEIVLAGALERLRARGVLPDQLLGDT
ncbi:RNA polymerase-binding protein RbpA [Micrococcaceae bacterium Sec5.1]|jgi:rubredoxin|uniref:RNA polymerase-binding protein RbpA n=1 Tax=unclassified Paenarthrobacter TaxID=2634190 RepID=UPI003365C791